MIGVHKPTESIAMSVDIHHTVGKPFDSLGWVDLPIMMQKEEHPSRAVRRRCGTDYVLRERNNLYNIHNGTTAEPLHNKCEPQSFGWSDFPVAIEQHVFSKQKTNPCRQNTIAHFSQRSHKTENPIASCTKHTIPIRAVPAERLSQWTDFLIVQPKRTVQFSNVRIRKHAVCLGDHPLCEDYPLSLDWPHDSTDDVMTIDAYEAQRTSPRSRITKLDRDTRRTRLAARMGIALTALDALEAERTALPSMGVLPRVPQHFVFTAGQSTQLVMR